MPARPGRRPILGAIALAAVPLLGGCVAAAAIPVLAGGAMAGTGLAKKDRGTGQPRVALPADPATVPSAQALPAPQSAAIVRSQDFPDGSRVEVTMPARKPVETMKQPAPAPQPARVSAATSLPPAGTTNVLADGTRFTILSGPLPAPGSVAPVARPEGDYAAFESFAANQGTLPVVGSERRSAMLADPGTLNTKTRNCAVQPAAVMIDLDPAGATLDPARPATADRALAGALASLRAQDIVIAWVSSLTADRAGAVRKALVASGLDPAGRDQLVLLRFPEERKQTRREDVAKELCVVALAGDERADFDELYQYLRNPAGATALEPLFGNGWFLIPSPLS